MPRQSNALTLKYTRYAERLLGWVARKYMMSVATLRGEERFPHIVAARREFILLAYAKGIGSTTIAKVLWRNESTIRYHFDPALQAARRIRYLAKRSPQPTFTENTDEQPTSRRPSGGAESVAARLGQLPGAGAPMARDHARQ